MKIDKYVKTGLLALALSLLAPNSYAILVTYDINWTGLSGNTMTGMFSYNSGAAADGFVRDRDGDLVSLMITSTDYGLSWTWSGDPTDPFNFNFIVATDELPINGAPGSTEAQSWNGTGVGIGLGFEGTSGRSGLLINGSFVEGTAGLSVTRRETVPEPVTLALLGVGMLGLLLRRSILA